MATLRRDIVLLSLAGLLGFAFAPLYAAEYPTRPVRIVVPSTPGGALDILARTISPKLMEKWGRQIVVDNRAGAGGIIGTEIVARSAPDGQTLLVVTTGFVTNPFLYKSLPYATPADFTPITIVGTSPYVLVVHPSVPLRSVKELINIAKDKPGYLNYASSGIGSGGHLSWELLQRMAKIKLIHVPYKGAGAATAAVVAGQNQFVFVAPGAAIPQIKANRLRAIAVTSAKRSEALPDVPTVSESGVPGYATEGWYSIMGPARMPKRLVERIYDDIVAVLKTREVASQIQTLGFDYDAKPPDEFARYVEAELKTWSAVIKDAELRAE